MMARWEMTTAMTSQPFDRRCKRCAQAMALLDLLWPDYDYLPRLAARIALAGRHLHLTR